MSRFPERVAATFADQSTVNVLAPHERGKQSAFLA